MKPIKNKFLFYFLSFTWGILMTSIGLLVALALLISGKKPKRHGLCWYFVVGKNWGGLNLGIIFLIDSREIKSSMDHEFGHAIQNCYFGILMPFVVAIPSAVRYNYLNIKYYRKNIECPVDYHSIWFEKSASELGSRWFE